MEFTIFDLATLLEIRRHQDVIPQFWINFFGRQINFETPYIDFERVNTRYRKLAPFVAPNVQGRVIKGQGSKVERLSPAYTKIKSVIDPQKVMTRVAGETIYQPLTNAQRRDVVVANEMQEHKQRHSNTLEWMCANAIIYGAYDIEGEDYPKSHVDFGRDASLTILLTGGAAWDQTTANPMGDIKTGRRRVNALTGGVVRRLVFGTNAWDLFCVRMGFNDPKSGNLLDTTFRGSETSISRILDGFEGAEFAGTLTGVNGAGRIECWVYSATYIDDTGATVPFLYENDVIGVGDVDGVRCFGAIQDKKAGYQALESFEKVYEVEDPSVEYLLSQSAPLMVPGEPNNTFRIRVKA